MADGTLGKAFEEGAGDMSEAAGQTVEAMGGWFDKSADIADAAVTDHVEKDAAKAGELSELAAGNPQAPAVGSVPAGEGSGSIGSILRGEDTPGLGAEGVGEARQPLGAGGKRDWPTDPSTGNRLEQRDLDFLGLTREQVEWWRNGEAPLGMTPEVYREWTSSMLDALRADGIPPEQVDVRLLGSAARGFSGPHKLIPSEQEISERFPRGVADAAIARRDGWLGDDPERLKGRPFDAMNKLGLDEPSDYDTNISNDLMVEKARSWWEANGRPGEFLSGDHEYVDKTVARRTFPNVNVWARSWIERLGRDVSWAVFPSSGPKDVSAAGHFVHFQDDDWVVHRPEGS